MKTKNIIIVALSCLIVTSNAFAQHNEFDNGHNGYVNANHDALLLRDSEESCIRTTYFNKPRDGIVACGDALPVESTVTVITQQNVIETVALSDKDNVLFEFDKAHLTSQGEQSLTDFMTKLGDVDRITIAGYTDAIGSPKYNMQLSIDRANTVKTFFVNHGFAIDKITAEGFGEESALVTADCLSQYGKVPTIEINKLQRQLRAKKFRARRLNKVVKRQKAKLANRLDMLQQSKSSLLACAAPDRKVVFIVDHVKQVSKLVNVTKVVNRNDINTTSDTLGSDSIDNSNSTNYDDEGANDTNSLEANQPNQSVDLDDNTADTKTNDNSVEEAPNAYSKVIDNAGDGVNMGSDTRHNPAPTDVLANPVLKKDSQNNTTTNNVIDDNE